MQPPARLSVNISLQQDGGGGRIYSNEEIELPAMDFLGFAAVMKRFHDLVEEITNSPRPKS